MVISIRKSIKDSYGEYPTIERIIWVQKWPSQSILCVSLMLWTAEVHDIFIVQKSGQMRKYHKFLTVFICIFLYEVYIFFIKNNKILF